MLTIFLKMTGARNYSPVILESCLYVFSLFRIKFDSSFHEIIKIKICNNTKNQLVYYYFVCETIT